jgi:hypothetical protein
MNITVNNQSITLKFGYGFLRVLGDMWQCKGPVAVFEKFSIGASALVAQLDGLDVGDIAEADLSGKTFDIPFEAVGVFTDIVQAAAQHGGNNAVLDEDETAQFLFENTAVMGNILQLFMDSMPKMKPEDSAGKPKAAPTAAKKKKA